MNYKKNDKVVLIDNLIEGDMIDGLRITKSLADLSGKTVQIRENKGNDKYYIYHSFHTIKNSIIDHIKTFRLHNEKDTSHIDIKLKLDAENHKMIDRVELHKQIVTELNDIYKIKNKDYGNNFTKVRAEYPNAICIRLSDKLERLKTIFSNNVIAVTDETLEDTLLDLANYAIMELVERRIDKTNETKDSTTPDDITQNSKDSTDNDVDSFHSGLY